MIKLEPKKVIDALGGEPMINLIILSGKKNAYFNIPSVYPEDFRFLAKENDSLIFEYYSSPVGYTQVIIIDSNTTQIYVSQAISETEEVILESINIAGKELKVQNEKGIETKKSLSLISWISCEG